MWNEKHEAEARQKAEEDNRANTDFIQKMTKSVLAQVAQASPELAGKDTEDAIETLREKYPAECRKVMEIACCASKRVNELEGQLARQEKEFESRLVQKKYEDVVHSAPGAHVQTEETVRASKRQRSDNEENPYAIKMQNNKYSISGGDTHSAEQICAAYKSLQGRGSAIDSMAQIANIVPQQRKRGFR